MAARQGFARTTAARAYDSPAEGPNPRSLWDVVHGLTELSHDIPHTGARTDLEVRAGRLLDLAA